MSYHRRDVRPLRDAAGKLVGPFTDLEKGRLEYFIENTELNGKEIAARLGRSYAAVMRYLYRQGIWLSEERGGERSWSGV